MAASKFDNLFAAKPAAPAAAPAPTPPSEPPRAADAPATTAAAEEAQPAPAPTARAARAEPRRRAGPATARPVGRPPGKRSDQAWKQFSVLLKIDTQREAATMLRAKNEGQDFSDLVQGLVESWIKRQR